MMARRCTQMERITIKKNVTNKAERAIYRNSSGKLKFPLSQPTLLSRRRNEEEVLGMYYLSLQIKQKFFQTFYIHTWKRYGLQNTEMSIFTNDIISTSYNGTI